MIDKNVKKELAKSQRAGFHDVNLGNRYFKSPKDFDRNKNKRDLKKMLDKY